MYGIFTNIWLIFMVNVGKYISPMNPMGSLTMDPKNSNFNCRLDSPPILWLRASSKVSPGRKSITIPKWQQLWTRGPTWQRLANWSIAPTLTQQKRTLKKNAPFKNLPSRELASISYPNGKAGTNIIDSKPAGDCRGHVIVPRRVTLALKTPDQTNMDPYRFEDPSIARVLWGLRGLRFVLYF